MTVRSSLGSTIVVAELAVAAVRICSKLGMICYWVALPPIDIVNIVLPIAV